MVSQCKCRREQRTAKIEPHKMAAEDAVAAALQPIDTTVQHGKRQDVKRAREFYRYFQPDNLVQPHLVRRTSTVEVYNDSVPSLSAALSPFCQLTALRVNACKALINVMDRDISEYPQNLSKRCHTKLAHHDYGRSLQTNVITLRDYFWVVSTLVPRERQSCVTSSVPQTGDDVPVFTQHKILVYSAYPLSLSFLVLWVQTLTVYSVLPRRSLPRPHSQWGAGSV